ncbi:M56 family peptidase, partial [Streptomyces fradiae]
ALRARADPERLERAQARLHDHRVPSARLWPPVSTAVGLAAWGAAAGTAASALSSANSAVTLFLILKAATPL